MGRHGNDGGAAGREPPRDESSHQLVAEHGKELGSRAELSPEEEATGEGVVQHRGPDCVQGDRTNHARGTARVCRAQ